MQIGEVYKITNSRRKVQISSYDNRSAIIWGTVAEECSIEVGTGYKVVAIKAANEFRGQRAYNSTPTTIFEVIVLTFSFNFSKKYTMWILYSGFKYLKLVVIFLLINLKYVRGYSKDIHFKKKPSVIALLILHYCFWNLSF